LIRFPLSSRRFSLLHCCWLIFTFQVSFMLIYIHLTWLFILYFSTLLVLFHGSISSPCIYFIIIFFNPKRWSSTSRVLSLLYRGHQFESHKPQGRWKLTLSLTSGLVKLVEVHAN
jgi:hypothetical protein